MIDSTNPRVIADNIKVLAANTGDIPIVEANPEREATANLEKLGVDGTVYGIPEGTIVEANPEEAATVDLSKLLIGETVYGITSGGITYSTTEFDTGKKWIDSSVIYGRVIDLSSSIDISYNSFTSLGITDLGTNVIIWGFAKGSSNYAATGALIENNNGTLRIQIPRLGNVFTNIKTVYIEYIKPVTP